MVTDGRIANRPKVFAVGLTVAALVAASVRVAYVLIAYGDQPFGFDDSFYFVRQGELLARGFGFVDPFFHRPSAAHPPLFSVYMAGVWLVDLRSVLQIRLAASALGVVAVVAVGISGRHIASARAGLLAGGLAAVMPYLWVTDGKVLSESLLALLTPLMLLAGSSFWRRPTPLRMVILAGAIGLMALTRAESVILYFLLVVPLAIVVGRRDSTPAWRPIGVAAATALVVLGPWVAYNNSRFEGPSSISNGMGPTLRVSNCDTTFGGERMGWWSVTCGTRSKATDEAIRAEDGRRHAQRYVRAHLFDVPGVMAARVGRIWGVFRPWQTASLESGPVRYALWPNRIGWMFFLALLPVAAYGALVLHRRSETIIPMVAIAVTVTLTAAFFWGGPRFAIPLDVTLCLLAGVGLDGLWPSPARRRRESDPPSARS